MRIFILWFTLLFSLPSFADTLYFSVGAGYKFNEAYIEGNKHYQINIKDTAQFEVGIQSNNIKYGIRHVSNWSEGWPVSDKQEYYKDEIFIEYKFDLLEF